LRTSSLIKPLIKYDVTNAFAQQRVAAPRLIAVSADAGAKLALGHRGFAGDAGLLYEAPAAL